MLTAFNFADALSKGLNGLLLSIDGIVYWVIGFLFELYTEIAGAEIINNSVYEEIRERFLVVVGVAMLFYLAYSLLKSMVNPDDAIKNTSKIVTNLVISLVLLTVVPSIFTYAFKLQNIIIDDHVIDNIVFGNSNTTVTSVGKTTAMNFFSAFVDVSPNAEIEGFTNWTSLQACILDESTDQCKDIGFRHITLLAASIVSGDTQYTFIISTICGCFLVYVIASFCLDMGVRVVKLAFYQIISPIPIMMRIIPEKKSVFDNWVKATLATYLEVFIRMFIMYIIAFLCSKIFADGVLDLSDNVGVLGTVIIVMGIFAFAKQAPKLIGDVIGVNAGNLKLGIKDKLAAGGAFTAGALIGGGVTAGIRNLTHGASNIKNAQGFGNKLKAAGRMFTSTAAGTISGAARSGYGARNAKNFGDMRSSASKGAQNAVQARSDRENYRANHGNSTIRSLGGHIADTGRNISAWAGITTPLEQLRIEQGKVKEIADARKAVNDRLKTLMEQSQNERMATIGQTVNGITYRNLTDLQNELEHMKNTGKDFSGNNITANTIREMQIAEEKLKSQLKKDILNGYDKNGVQNMDKYDAQLRDLMVSYRTKTASNFNAVKQHADRTNADVNTAVDNLEKAIEHNNQSIQDFILNGHGDELFDGNKAIQDANSKINEKITTSAQRDRQNNS